MNSLHKLYGFFARTHRFADGSVIRPCTRESLEVAYGPRHLEVDFMPDAHGPKEYVAYLDVEHYRWREGAVTGAPSAEVTLAEAAAIEQNIIEYAKRRGVSLRIARTAPRQHALSVPRDA
jgi:hypothetical protein